MVCPVLPFKQHPLDTRYRDQSNSSSSKQMQRSTDLIYGILRLETAMLLFWQLCRVLRKLNSFRTVFAQPLEVEIFAFIYHFEIKPVTEWRMRRGAASRDKERAAAHLTSAPRRADLIANIFCLYLAHDWHPEILSSQKYVFLFPLHLLIQWQTPIQTSALVRDARCGAPGRAESAAPRPGRHSCRGRVSCGDGAGAVTPRHGTR